MKLCKKCKKELLKRLSEGRYHYLYGVSASQIIKELKDEIKNENKKI